MPARPIKSDGIREKPAIANYRLAFAARICRFRKITREDCRTLYSEQPLAKMQFGRSTLSGVCSSIFTVFISKITTSADLFGRIDNGTQARSKIIKNKKEKNNNPVRIFNLRAIRYVQRYLIVRTFAQSDLLKSDLRYRNSSFTLHIALIE